MDLRPLSETTIAEMCFSIWHLNWIILLVRKLHMTSLYTKGFLKVISGMPMMLKYLCFSINQKLSFFKSKTTWAFPLKALTFLET